MTMKHTLYTVSLFCAAAALSACSGPLFHRSAPDEFSVADARPLTMPPEFRLPAPGSDTRALLQRDRTGGAAMLRGEGVADGGSYAGSEGEAALLNRLGAQESDGAARASLGYGTGRTMPGEPVKKKSFLSGFFGDGDNASAKVVDPAAERKRIEKAQKEGEAITGDGTEDYREGGNQGLLQRWFGN